MRGPYRVRVDMLGETHTEGVEHVIAGSEV
ncbi:hypothetical protein DEV91_1783 [Phyllobacterium brassicacearum]|nr:hypothetical protein DEV91_1783 [Phyllobacterium brassicacearum]